MYIFVNRGNEKNNKKFGKIEKKPRKLCGKCPSKLDFLYILSPKLKKKWKPGYPGFEVKKPDPPKGPKTRVPGFPGTRVPNTNCDHFSTSKTIGKSTLQVKISMM